jgi:hypothetical protein
MRQHPLPVCLLVLCIGMSAPLPAQDPVHVTARPVAPLNCRVVEAFGNASRDTILANINATVAGQERRINRRKTLVIHEVDDIRFTGCDVLVDANVTLERRIRRDARGNAQVAGRVASISRERRQLCFERNPRVVRMDVSNTGIIGESMYRWVANMVQPVDRCVPFDL